MKITNETELIAVIEARLTALDISAQTEVRRRFKPTRTTKSVEVIVIVGKDAITEQLFNRLSDDMLDIDEIRNLESMREVERKSELEFFVIEAQYDYVRGS